PHPPPPSSPRPAPSASPASPSNAERGLPSAEKPVMPHPEPQIPKPRLSTGEHPGEGAAKFAERGFKARSPNIGVSAWGGARTGGKVLVMCFVPLTVLDVVIEVAMRLWDRDREKEARKRREKQRALEAVFKEGGSWIDQAIGKKPPPSLQQLI